MKTLRLATAFKKDLKRIIKRNYDQALLEQIIDALRDGQELTAAQRDHPLKGEWKGWRECHIEPDWLLIYSATDDELLLARTATHDDLFGTSGFFERRVSPVHPREQSFRVRVPYLPFDMFFFCSFNARLSTHHQKSFDNSH